MSIRVIAMLTLAVCAFAQHRGAEPRQQGGHGPGGGGSGMPDRWPGGGGMPGGGGGAGRSPRSEGGISGGAVSNAPRQETLQDRIAVMRRQLREESVYGDDRLMVRGLAATCLDRSEQANRNKKQRFVADRLFVSASALQQALTYSQKLSDAKTAPSREQVSAHLQSAYFRMQQADYFLEASGDSGARPLPDLARRWYQKALQFLDTDPGTADNYANAATQLVSALESMAQANASVQEGQKGAKKK